MLTLSIFDELEEEDFDLDFVVIEETTSRVQVSYNREAECDAVAMTINNREEW
jgi:hypothetical protein